MKSTVLKVNGMTCMGCVASVTRVLKAIDGVKAVDVSLDKAQASIDYDEGAADIAKFKSAIDAAGYEASV